MTEACGVTPAEILAFWRAAGRERWYERDDTFDADVRSMQADDVANPGFLWIERGEKLWREGGKSCNVCHGDAPTSMRGVAARWRVGSHTALLVAALAFGNMLIWSLVTPPFEGPDEYAHVSYAVDLAERGKAPTPASTGKFTSTEMIEALDATSSFCDPWRNRASGVK